jgi:hypothetical protein
LSVTRGNDPPLPAGPFLNFREPTELPVRRETGFLLFRLLGFHFRQENLPRLIELGNFFLQLSLALAILQLSNLRFGEEAGLISVGK